MATFVWKVTDLQVLPSVDDKFNVVTNVQFSVTVTKDDNTTETQQIYTSFKQKEGDTFIPFESLTEDIIIGWLGERKQIMENNLLEQINNPRLEPTPRPLPWVRPVTGSVEETSPPTDVPPELPPS